MSQELAGLRGVQGQRHVGAAPAEPPTSRSGGPGCSPLSQVLRVQRSTTRRLLEEAHGSQAEQEPALPVGFTSLLTEADVPDMRYPRAALAGVHTESPPGIVQGKHHGQSTSQAGAGPWKITVPPPKACSARPVPRARAGYNLRGRGTPCSDGRCVSRREHGAARRDSSCSHGTAGFCGREAADMKEHTPSPPPARTLTRSGVRTSFRGPTSHPLRSRNQRQDRVKLNHGAQRTFSFSKLVNSE